MTSNTSSSAMVSSGGDAAVVWQSTASAREKRKGRVKDEDDGHPSPNGASARGRQSANGQRKRMASGPFKFYRPMIDEQSGVYATSAPPRNSFLTITDNVDLHRVATGDLSAMMSVKKKPSHPYEQQHQQHHGVSLHPIQPQQHPHPILPYGSNDAHHYPHHPIYEAPRTRIPTSSSRGARHVRAAHFMAHAPPSPIPAAHRGAFVPVVRQIRPRAIHPHAATAIIQSYAAVQQQQQQQQQRPLLPPLWNVTSGIYFPSAPPPSSAPPSASSATSLPSLVYLAPEVAALQSLRNGPSPLAPAPPTARSLFP